MKTRLLKKIRLKYHYEYKPEFGKWFIRSYARWHEGLIKSEFSFSIIDYMSKGMVSSGKKKKWYNKLHALHFQANYFDSKDYTSQ